MVCSPSLFLLIKGGEWGGGVTNVGSLHSYACYHTYPTPVSAPASTPFTPVHHPLWHHPSVQCVILAFLAPPCCTCLDHCSWLHLVVGVYYHFTQCQDCVDCDPGYLSIKPDQLSCMRPQNSLLESSHIPVLECSLRTASVTRWRLKYMV